MHGWVTHLHYSFIHSFIFSVCVITKKHTSEKLSEHYSCENYLHHCGCELRLQALNLTSQPSYQPLQTARLYKTSLLSQTDFACHYTEGRYVAESDLCKTHFHSTIIHEDDWAEQPWAVWPPAERHTAVCHKGGTHFTCCQHLPRGLASNTCRRSA